MILRRGNTLLLAEIRILDGPARNLVAVWQRTYQFSHSAHSPSKDKQIEVQEFIQCMVRKLHEKCMGNTVGAQRREC